MPSNQPVSIDNTAIRSVLSWLEQALLAVRSVYYKRDAIAQRQVPFVEIQNDMHLLLGLLQHKPNFQHFHIHHVWQLDAYLRALGYWMRDAAKFSAAAANGAPDAALTDEMWMSLLMVFDNPDVAGLRRALRMRHGYAITSMMGRLQNCRTRAHDLVLVRVDVGHQGDYGFAGLGIPDGYVPFIQQCNQLRQLIREEFSRGYVHDEAKLIYTWEKGLRARLLLVMDAQEVLSDEGFGDAVCRLWTNQVGGTGAHAYNCNNNWHKARQIPCGIGYFPMTEGQFAERINPMVVSLAKADTMLNVAFPSQNR